MIPDLASGNSISKSVILLGDNSCSSEGPKLWFLILGWQIYSQNEVGRLASGGKDTYTVGCLIAGAAKEYS